MSSPRCADEVSSFIAPGGTHSIPGPRKGCIRNHGELQSRGNDADYTPRDYQLTYFIRAQYTEIIYMDFRWSEATRTGFDTASQRARYLKCDARINLPIDETPLYGIQYMSYRRQPIYAPPKPVLNIVETNTALYLSLIHI